MANDNTDVADMEAGQPVDVSEMSESETNEVVDEMLSVASTVDLSAEESEETDEPEGLDSLPLEKREALEEALEERDQIAAEQDEETPADSTSVRVASDDDEDETEDVTMDDIEDYDFENQEWTLGEEKPESVKEIKGMRFQLSEPADDELLNSMENAGDSRAGQMKAWCQMVVDKPEITNERWDNMTSGEHLAMATMCAEYVGVEDFIDL